MKPRSALLRHRELVARQLRDLGVDVASPRGDEADVALAAEQADTATVRRAQLVASLRSIDRALARLRAGDGTYGVCLDCQQPIARTRLKLLPDAETCVGCQAIREQAATVANGAPGRVVRTVRGQ